jgi:hypothetical protein
VGPRAGLDHVERRKILPLPGLELRPLGRPAGSQSLYRLRYTRPIYEHAHTGARMTLQKPYIHSTINHEDVRSDEKLTTPWTPTDISVAYRANIL